MKKMFAICMAMLLVFSLACFAGAEDWTEKEITLVFEEHVANVQQQAPQIYAAAQAFMEKYPNVTIELVGNSEDVYTQKMKLAAQSDTLPDIFWLAYADAVEFMNAGYLAELGQSLNQETELIESFLPNAYGVLSSEDGGVYGISCEMQCDCYWINKALFEQYNVPLPSTWEDMLAAAEIFNQNGVIPLAMGTSASLGTWMVREAIWYYDLGEIYPQILEGSAKWSNDTFKAFYENWEAAREAKLLPESSVTLDYYAARELFLTGQAAMFGSGTWDTYVMESSEIAQDIYFWWGPTFENAPVQEQIQMITAGNPYVVSKHAQEDPAKFAAIVEFLKFYYGPEGSTIVVDTNSVPVTKFSGEQNEEETPVFARVIQEISTAKVPLDISAKSYMAPDIYSAFEESFLGVFNGVFTPETACETMDMQVQMALMTQ